MRRDGREPRVGYTTRSTPTHGAPACPICIPTSRPCSSICSARRARWRGRSARPRSCSRARAAGRSCRTSTRATARPRRRSSSRALRGARAAPSAALVCDSGMQATALVFDALLAAGAPRGADAAGLQQDQDVPDVARRPRRRRGHDRRRRRPDGARGGDSPGDALRLRRDLHQPAGARAGPRRAARGSSARRADARPRCGSSSTPPSRRRGHSRRRSSIKASTSSSPAAPRRSAAGPRPLGLRRDPRHADSANAVMDLMAMRGGILDWRRATAIVGRPRRRRARRMRVGRRPPAASRRFSRPIRG